MYFYKLFKGIIPYLALAIILPFAFQLASPQAIFASEPDSGQAVMILAGPDGTQGTYADVFLNNGNALPGWCISATIGANTGIPYMVTIYDYFGNYYPDDHGLPDYIRSRHIDWNGIAFVINHKQGTFEDIQDALWYFSDGVSTTRPLANAMIQAALDYKNSFGPFIPGPQQWKPIICDAGPTLQLIIYEGKIPLNSTTLTQLTKSNLLLGQSVNDNATIFGSANPPTGTITFEVSEDGGLNWNTLGAPKPLLNGSATSDLFTPAKAGNQYRFRAIYSGDGTYSPSQSGDQDEPLNVIPPVPAFSNLSIIIIISGFLALFILFTSVKQNR